MQVLAAVMPRMKMDMAEQMKEAQQLYLKYGITTVQEGAAMAQTMQGFCIGFAFSKCKIQS